MRNKTLTIVFICSWLFFGSCKNDATNPFIEGVETGYFENGFFLGYQLRFPIKETTREFTLIDADGDRRFYMVYNGDVYYSGSYLHGKSITLTEDNPTIYLKFLIWKTPQRDAAKSLHNEAVLYIGKFPKGLPVGKSNDCRYIYHGFSELL